MTVTERIAVALERIADAFERQVDADPLAMFSEVLQGDGDSLAGALATPQEPMAGNGMTVLYKHPNDPALQIVARRDRDAEGGYSVGVEPA
jgi:hypothetical protein